MSELTQSERLQGPERGPESGLLSESERMNVPGRGPESVSFIESTPRPTSTGA